MWGETGVGKVTEAALCWGEVDGRRKCGRTGNTMNSWVPVRETPGARISAKTNARGKTLSENS